jgi:phytoene dehydrogenase-like protein
MDDHPVIIVGAGLAGLRCAGALQAQQIPWLLLEAQDGPGGRMRTDAVDGFQLDRGFQVLLTAYPEARRTLDYDALDLRPFDPAALIRLRGGFHRVADPLRNPGAVLSTLRAPIWSASDKLRVVRLRRRLRRLSLPEIWRRPERTTREALADYGFSSTMVETFWRPLLAAIQLDSTLSASSRMFDFVLRMLIDGRATLPAAGIQAIPDQLAAGLPPGRIRYGATVVAVDPTGVWLDDGELIHGQAVVVATDGPTANRLLPAIPAPASSPVGCLYFAAERPPVDEPVIVLNGEGTGVIATMCVPSVVAPSYAPAGLNLVSVTVLAPPADPLAIEGAVRDQLRRWFGRRVDAWRLLRRYDIPHATPRQQPPTLAIPQRPIEVDAGVFCCGDHRDNASIDGALSSGQRAADALAASFSRV